MKIYWLKLNNFDTAILRILQIRGRVNIAGDQGHHHLNLGIWVIVIEMMGLMIGPSVPIVAHGTTNNQLIGTDQGQDLMMLLGYMLIKYLMTV